MALVAPAFDASGLLSELLSLVGTEVVMLFLGLITYLLFSGQNMLPVYWSYVSAWLFTLDTVVAPSTVASGFAATTGDHQAKKMMIDSQTEDEECQDNKAPEEDVECQEQQLQKISTAPAAAPSCVLGETLTDGRLNVDLVANVFLCLELNHLGSMAATCRAARANLWQDAEVWLALGGPKFAPAYQLLGQPGELHLPSLRSQFRTWVYGLDNASWGSAFAERAACRNQAELFEEAAFLLGGIQETEDLAQVRVFEQCLVDQLALMDAGEDTAQRAATQLLAKAQARRELLGEFTLFQMRKAFDESVKDAAKRALAAKAWEDARLEQEWEEDEAARIRSPFELEDDAEEVENASAAESSDVGTALGPLALSFLAALGSSHGDRSVDVAA